MLARQPPAGLYDISCSFPFWSKNMAKTPISWAHTICQSMGSELIMDYLIIIATFSVLAETSAQRWDTICSTHTVTVRPSVQTKAWQYPKPFHSYPTINKYPFVHPPIHPLIHFPIHLPTHSSIHWPIHPCTHWSICPSIHPCWHPCMHPSRRLSTHLLIHPLIHPSIVHLISIYIS